MTQTTARPETLLITLTGNAFQEFRTRADQEGLLDAVRRHLAPGGLFAFETRFPRPSELLTPEALAGEWSPETVWRSFEDDAGRTVTVSTSQRHDAIAQTVEYVIYRRWEEDGEPRVETERHTHRRQRHAPLAPAEVIEDQSEEIQKTHIASIRVVRPCPRVAFPGPPASPARPLAWACRCPTRSGP